MEIRQLRYAVLLDEHRNFSKAAQAAFITQSAFSQQIAQLERELDAKLFHRGQTGTVPSAAGERFIAHARSVLEGLSRLGDDVRAIAHGSVGTLHVGLFGTGAGELTPLIVDEYRSAVPGVALVFHELSMTGQFDELLNGTVDVAVLHPLCDRDDVVFTPLFDEPRYAALPRRHRLADAHDVSVDDLVDTRFVLAGAGTPDEWRTFWSCDSAPGKAPKSAPVMHTIGEGLDAVAYLNVVDTVPASLTRHRHHPGVSFVPLRDATYSSIAVARRGDDDREFVGAFCHLADRLAARHHPVVPGAVRAPAGTGAAAPPSPV